MNRFLATTVIFITSILNVAGQEQINESMPFQNDPDKEYSIFSPSSYQQGEAIPAFLALHPFNTNRWNAQTWCEELADFAEENSVILICPDGGEDGKIDDPIDTAFTSFLLDSAFIWYTIDETKLYATGFSWGGKTTYTYGLNHIDKFAGLLPIGAAINVGEIDGIAENVENIPVYIVHGSLDSPNVRYYPLLEAMQENEACVESNLLTGVGHTIDFANQVEILSEAYAYLQDNTCTITSTDNTEIEKLDLLPYSMVEKGRTITLNRVVNSGWQIYSFDGQWIKDGNSEELVVDMTRGIFIIKSGKQSQLFTVF